MHVLYYLDIYFLGCVERLKNLIFLYIKMETIHSAMTQPKRRGRPPQTFEMINGQPYVTQETLEREIEMLEKHRTACRNRYRMKRDMLKTLRPDLFHNRNGSRTNQQVIRRFGIPIGPNFLQATQEEGSGSNPENGTGLREISLREIYFGSTPEVSGQDGGI